MEKDLNQTSHRPVAIWLFAGCVMIALMVVVGGITRLTQSGLSIVDWRPVTGFLPPLNEDQWQTEFSKYQTSPQFKYINAQFTLSDFKSIFWWEYIHRLLGRLIGIVFLVPFVWFLIKRKLKGRLLRNTLILFLLGGLQGFIGWIMVKSGLQDMPHVSHYRLALHLMTALIVFAFTLWFGLNILYPEPKIKGELQKRTRKHLLILLALVFCQIIYGAFVAGLKAGSSFHTFPLMDGKIIPDEVGMGFEFLGLKSLFEFAITVQFIHRMFAWAIFFWGIYIFIKCIREKELKPFQPKMNWVLIAILLQFTLGIITILTGVPVIMGVLHQAGALFLWTVVWFSLHGARKSTSPLSPPTTSVG